MKTIFKPTFWKIILLIIFIMGAYSIYIRFAFGLGAASAMNDMFPWGFWIGFDLLSGVGLSAGGFVICATIYLFKSERYRPLVRPAVLTAFLGYLSVIFIFLVELGKPYNIYLPVILWNTKSVMFEIAWCVMLYTIVLFFEFSPVISEKFKLTRTSRTIKRFIIPIVIAGVILSTLHQSSLGSLFLIIPERMHPFWYSPLLPFLFFTSSISAGLAVIIFESNLSSRFFKRELNIDLLSRIGKILAVSLSIYLILKLSDFNNRRVWHYFAESGKEKYYLLAEIIPGVILPMILLFFEKFRKTKSLLFFNAILVIWGLIINRLNVCIISLEANAGTVYIPTFLEISISLFRIAAIVTIFALAVKYLEVFPKKENQ
jgi:Ni/Fe-hydrogenase subunit HybB-like protein